MTVRISPLVRQILCFLSGPIACMLIKDLPPMEGMAPQGMTCLAGCVWLMLWWLTGIFSMPVTSIMSIPIFGFLGVLTPAKVFSVFGDPSMMLIFGATIIVGLWKESNFIERYAYWCFNFPFVKGSARRLLFVFVFGVGLMSAIAPNVPLAILFVSIAVMIGRACQLDKNSNLMRSLCVFSAIAPAVGGAATPIGGAPNMVVIALIATSLQYSISFWEWSALGIPLVLIALFIIFFISGFAMPLRGKESHLPVPEEYLRKKLDDLGPITRYEHIAIIVMVTAFILWCFGPQIADFLGWKAGVKMLTAPVVAVFMGALTFLIPLRKDEKSGKLIFSMSWEQAIKHIGWGILVIQIGTLSFGNVLLMGGLDKWAASQIQTLAGDLSGAWVWFFFVVITGLASQVVTNLALAALLIPIMANLAIGYGFHPIAACLSVGFACNIATCFPFSSLTVAAAMIGGGEYVHAKDFLVTGLITTLSISILSFLICYFLGPIFLPAWNF